ncbi:MAG TPA: TonB family protein [Verrucomicrobiae bacterium]|jgi:TonB family protein
MGRLQKKCFVASACLHGLLLGVLIFGSGFFSGRKIISAPVLEFIPANAILTDGATSGGGNPNVTTPPAAGSPAPPAPAVAKAEPPKSKAREPEPEPPKPARSPDSFSLPKDTKSSKKTAKTETKRELGLDKKITRTPPKQTATKSTDSGSKQSDTARELAKRVGESIGVLSHGLSKGVGVEVPGPGGMAFVNYRDVILSAYKRRFDRELESVGANLRPGVSVDVLITITRDGQVVEKSITRASGVRALDDAVRRVIDGVREIAPFPAEAKDARRTFNVTFEPRVDRLTG